MLPSNPPSGARQYRLALRFFEDRVPRLQRVMGRLQAKSADIAFTVAGVADVRLLNDVWQALNKAVEEGTTFAEFKADVGAELTAAWGGENPYRLETIFRTNVQTAYNEGRWEQANDPEVAEIRPFLRYVALLDTRTSRICSAINGTVLPLNHPFWRSHWPPLHFSCRSTVLSIMESQAADLGVGPKPTGGATPTAGFGRTPDQEPEALDLTGIASELVSASKVG